MEQRAALGKLGGPFSFCAARRRIGQAGDDLRGLSPFGAAHTDRERGVAKLCAAFLF